MGVGGCDTEQFFIVSVLQWRNYNTANPTRQKGPTAIEAQNQLCLCINNLIGIFFKENFSLIKFLLSVGGDKAERIVHSSLSFRSQLQRFYLHCHDSNTKYFWSPLWYRDLVCTLEVCTGPSLARDQYPAGEKWFFQRAGPGQQMRDDFSKRPSRASTWGVIFPMGRAGPAHERWLFGRAGPGQQKEKWVF